jgi:hypothetical protein
MIAYARGVPSRRATYAETRATACEKTAETDEAARRRQLRDALHALDSLLHECEELHLAGEAEAPAGLHARASDLVLRILGSGWRGRSGEQAIDPDHIGPLLRDVIDAVLLAQEPILDALQPIRRQLAEED